MTYRKRNVYLDLILRHPLLDVNLQRGDATPLIQAALEVGDAEAARILIDRGADLRCGDDFGRNILHLISADDFGIDLVQHVIATVPYLQYQNPRDEVNLLVCAGVDVTIQDANGDTPLHILFRRPFLLVADYDGDAVWRGFVKNTIDLLLSKEADINARNKAGETPVFGYFRTSSFKVDLNWAKLDEERHTLSKKWGGDRWKVNKELKEQIVEETEPKIWALFDDMGVDWSVLNVKGESLLHVIAARKGYAQLTHDPDDHEFPLSEANSVEDQANDTIALLDSLQVQTFIPISHFQGGWCAMEMAVRLGKQRVPAVLLTDFNLTRPPPEFIKHLQMIQNKETWHQGQAPLIKKWLNNTSNKNVLDHCENDLDTNGFENWSYFCWLVEKNYERWGSPMERLGIVEDPPLVRHVFSHPREEAYLAEHRAFARRHPDWFSFARLNGESHFSIVELPEAVSLQLSDLVRQVNSK
ncbi:hypothetical protein FANTH_8180 [Fusarium anthophilum]|uniref:Ankyrin n=1 Tax=Fusarium anthophilum TaxID=48485 RepID=A0A8H4ZD10_9HYPO|nr:hypothetical protein FANTH_8180 [Fusarium anthophilum]